MEDLHPPATPAPERSPATTNPQQRTYPAVTWQVNVGAWSTEEHERYLQAKYANPKASWKEIAQFVGTRSARQVILHDQKFRAKMERQQRKNKASAPPGANDSGLRYIDSMGVLLLASVATSRMQRIPEPEPLPPPTQTFDQGDVVNKERV